MNLPFNTEFSTWTNPERAGLLPEIFDAGDPSHAAAQIQTNYAHGGGFRSMKGDGDWLFELNKEGKLATLHYPEDPPFIEVSRCHLPLTNETLILFQAGVVVIVQAEGQWDVCRMD